MKANLLAERLLLTLWVGSLCAIGYIAVPMAFATLGDVTQAGNYAGKLFSAVNMLGLACGSVLIMSKLLSQGKRTLALWRFWVLVTMFLLTLLFSCYLQPEIATVKALMQQDGNEIEHFDLLHSLSKNIYLFISVLGLALVVSSDKVEA